MEEVWKVVPNVPVELWASSLGRVRRWYRCRWLYLYQWTTKRGYLRINVRLNEKRFGSTVHALVAMAFHGPRPPGAQCRHINTIKKDNRAENLQWGSPRENSRDSYCIGKSGQSTLKRRNRMRVDFAITMRNAQALRNHQVL